MGEVCSVQVLAAKPKGKRDHSEEKGIDGRMESE
jgi:hypothetical protein